MPQVFDWISHYANYSPDKIAAIDAATGREYTYQQFDQRIASLAGYFQQEWQIRKDDRIAVLAMNCTEYFEIQFACARLGAIMVPLNWRLALPELEYIVSDCAPKALIHDAAFQKQAATLQENGRLLQIDFGKENAGNFESVLKSTPPLAKNELFTHDDLSAIIYTSGTTGRPKGAMITHGMIFWNAVNIGMAVGLTSRARTYNVLPTFHTGGLNLYANPSFHVGATAVIARTFDPDETLNWLSPKSITHFFGVPTVYLLLSQNRNFASADLSGVESWASGGAALPVSLLHEYANRGIMIRQGCGMTETSPTVFLIDEENAVRKAGSVGKPALHTSVRIISREGNDVQPGEVGELCIKGPNVTPGYWQNPEATEEAIRDGWLHSGDAAQMDTDGYFYIVDRWKDMYISGGENVYPAEVEQVVYEMPEIAEVAVIGVPDEKWGEAGKAIVVLKVNAILSEAQIIAHCQQKLAKYKVPKSVGFVSELPHTAAGKVKKMELRRRFG